MASHGILYTLLHWVVSGFALIVTAYLVRGFKVSSFSSALLAAIFGAIVLPLVGAGLHFLLV